MGNGRPGASLGPDGPLHRPSPTMLAHGGLKNCNFKDGQHVNDKSNCDKGLETEKGLISAHNSGITDESCFFDSTRFANEIESEATPTETGCCHCVQLAASLVQFYEIKKNLESEDCMGCIQNVDACMELLEMTKNLMILKSCHRKKKGQRQKGSRWQEIQREHLRKMEDQLAVANPDFDWISHIERTSLDPGEPDYSGVDYIQGCLSRPRVCEATARLSTEFWEKPLPDFNDMGWLF